MTVPEIDVSKERLDKLIDQMAEAKNNEEAKNAVESVGKWIDDILTVHPELCPDLAKTIKEKE